MEKINVLCGLMRKHKYFSFKNIHQILHTRYIASNHNFTNTSPALTLLLIFILYDKKVEVAGYRFVDSALSNKFMCRKQVENNKTSFDCMFFFLFLMFKYVTCIIYFNNNNKKRIETCIDMRVSHLIIWILMMFL